MGLLQGKRGLVFGVANEQSIAWACAQACFAQGATLGFNILAAAQERRLRDLLGDRPCLVHPCDVQDDGQIDGFFEAVDKEWDRIDFVIHAVAFAQRRTLREPFVDTRREDFREALDVSAYSLVALAKRAAPRMTGGGSVVSMSYYGAEKVIPHYNVMGVAKSALESCTKYLAADLGPRGIRVNSVSAGPLRTLSSSAIPGIQGMIRATELHAPLRKPVTAQQVAHSTVYLLSDLSSGVTGEVHHVDSGYHVLGALEEGPA